MASAFGYGLLWAFWSLILVVAFLSTISRSAVGALVCLALAGFAIRYCYRIWTWQARRLIFFIVW